LINRYTKAQWLRHLLCNRLTLVGYLCRVIPKNLINVSICLFVQHKEKIQTKHYIRHITPKRVGLI